MNPDNYGSLPACKKLAEVLAKKGHVIETEVCWYRDTPDWYLGLAPTVTGPYTLVHIPAPSMAEVWRELPKNATLTKGYDNWAFIDLGISPRIDSSMHNSNPTDALIELWIWVLAREE